MFHISSHVNHTKAILFNLPWKHFAFQTIWKIYQIPPPGLFIRSNYLQKMSEERCATYQTFVKDYVE